MDPSRVMIHADNGDLEGGNHPQWKGDDGEELTSFPFANSNHEFEELDGMIEINARLERMLDKAPSDSTANLLVRKTANGYKAFLRVRSSNRGFKSFITGQRLRDVVERVVLEVRSQIDGWKESRQLT